MNFARIICTFIIATYSIHPLAGAVKSEKPRVVNLLDPTASTTFAPCIGYSTFVVRSQVDFQVAIYAASTPSPNDCVIIELASNITLTEATYPSLANAETGIKISNAQVIINGNNFVVNGDNRMRCFYIYESEVTMNNLGIVNCLASTTGKSVYGGGIYLTSISAVAPSILKLENCSMSRNAANFLGGALYAEYSSIKIMNSTISENNAAHAGGGIYITFISTLHMSTSKLVGNTASYSTGGAGLFLNSPSSVTPTAAFLDRCLVADNYVNYGTGNGGGVVCQGTSIVQAQLHIRNCIFSSNTCPSSGGGVYISYGHVSIMNTKFNLNKASLGAAIFSDSSTTAVTLDSCTLVDNTASTYGGGLYMGQSGPTVTFRNSEVSGNVAIGSEGGGGVYFVGGVFYGTGLEFTLNSPNDFAGASAGSALCDSSCTPGLYGARCEKASGAPMCVVNCDCALCPPGTASAMSALVGNESCSSCGIGQYASHAGSTSCASCEIGHYATNSETDNGGGLQSQVVTGATNCNKCPAGYYASSLSQIVCQACLQGRFSSPGSDYCSLAAANFFLMPSTELSTKCPDCAQCLGGQEMPRPQEGYWVDRSSALYVSALSKCSRSTCKGAQLLNSSQILGFESGTLNSSCWSLDFYDGSIHDDAEDCSSDNLLCTEGATGPLCGSCIARYVYYTRTQKCGACSTVAGFIFTVFSLFLLAMMFPEECLLLFSMIRDRMNIPDEWQGFAVFGIFRQFDQGTLRVLISTYQIIDSVTWNLTLALPPPFSTLLQLFSLLSFDFLQSRCLQLDTTVYSDVYFYALVPILFAGASLAVFFGKCFFAGRIPRRSEESAYSFAILVMTYLVLPPVSRVLLQALDCERLPGSGARVLRVDTNVDCDSATYKSFILVDALLIVVYMSVPLAWSVILCRNRARLNPKTTEIEVAQRLRDEDLELRPLSFLFDIYYPRFYFFEAIEMYRRVLFVGLLPLITTETDRRAALGLILALCSAILFRETEPYTLWTTNVIANVAQYTIFLTYGVALVINTDLRKGLSNDELGLFLFCVNLFVLSIAIGFGVERHLREDRLRHQGRRILTSQEFKIVDNVMKDEDGEPGDGDESDYEAGPDRYNSASRNSEFGGRPSTLMHRSANALSQHLLNPKDVKIIKRIGSGAFGEVFRGECLGQQIAVKTMHKVTDENVRFFRAEILLTATLRHPNIVNFVGACWGKELICLVLEWVPKGSLGDMLTDMAVDLRWDEPLLRLATDIARGMQYLHGREYYDERERTLKRCILHRDLKPQNALVTEFSGAKLADFGSSRAKSNRGVTMTAVGTPLYAAPELMRHESYDETIDVYSFGLMLLDMAVHGGLLDLVRGRWFVCHNADDGRCSSASEIERACKDHVDIRRVLRSMWDKQWRPVSDEWGIPAAPLSVVELIVACCAHDPAQRPSFSDIFHQLAGRCAAEIEAGAFRRWRIDEEKAALLERHLKLSTSSTTRTSHREPTLSVIVEGTSPVDSFEKSLALGSDLAVGKLGFGSSLRAPTNGGGSGAVGFGAVGFGGSQPNQRVSWSPMVGVRSSVTRSSRTVGLEERLLDSEEYLTPAVDAEAGWSSSSSAAVAAGSVTSTAGDSAASMAACSVASTASASPHDAQLFFQGVDTTNASTTTQKHTGFPSDV